MKKISVAFVLLICSILFGCATKFERANPMAFGRKWSLLGVNVEDKSQSFYDPASVSCLETNLGNIIRFDCRMVDTLGYESLGVCEVDCQKDIVRIFDIVKYDKYFRFVGQQPDVLWIYYRPYSVFGEIKLRFCK